MKKGMAVSALAMVAGFSMFLLASCVVQKGENASRKDEFAGSQACRECHSVEYESWEQTLHSQMVRKKDEGILKAVVEKWATDGTNPGPAKGNGTGEAFTLDDVDLVVGSHWKQRFLVKNKDTGNHQFMDKQFNRMSEKWEPYGQKNDWEFMCATCHATGYRLTSYDPANPRTAKAAWVEVNTGCEACHGPGAKHVQTKAKADIWNPAQQPKDVQARACGYCHLRMENERYKSPQGNFREDFPAPQIGDTFKPWDDWTKWYPEETIIPGVHAKDRMDVEYTGDLKGIFILDDIAKKTGVYDSGKHHQEYQDFLQSKHYQNGVLSCNDCHMPHAGKGIKQKVARETCKTCHEGTYSYEKIMPGTGGTAKDLTVRSHTFFKDQSRVSKPTATGKAVLYKDRDKK